MSAVIPSTPYSFIIYLLVYCCNRINSLKCVRIVTDCEQVQNDMVSLDMVYSAWQKSKAVGYFPTAVFLLSVVFLYSDIRCIYAEYRFNFYFNSLDIVSRYYLTRLSSDVLLVPDFLTVLCFVPNPFCVSVQALSYLVLEKVVYAVLNQLLNVFLTVTAALGLSQ